MSKLLLIHSPHFTPVYRRTITSFLSKSHLCLSSTPLPLHSTSCLLHPLTHPSLLRPFPSLILSRNLSVRAFDSSSDTKTQKQEETSDEKVSQSENGSIKNSQDDYPTGDFEFKEIGAWNRFLVKLRMLIAFPWERVRKGSVLTMKLRGQVFLSINFLMFLNYYWHFISDLNCIGLV